MLTKKIGIDLGTNNTRIFVPKKGVVLEEPTVVARDVHSHKTLAVGKPAREMVGRTPETIELYRPLIDGVIADFRATQTMLKHYLSQALGNLRLFKPAIMISIPSSATSTERKAVVDVALAVGARDAYLVQAPVAAALGAGIDIDEPRGNMIIDVGGGTTEIAVLSLGGLVAKESIRIGGNKVDSAISDYLRRQYSLSTGEQTIESVKRAVGTALLEGKRDPKTDVKGRDIVTGLPKTVTIASREFVEPIRDIVEKIVLAVRSVLERTPPDLVSDIIDQGIVLSGGSAKLKNLDKLLVKVIGVPVTIADHPTRCTALGMGRALAALAEYQKSQLVS